jgi:hypothetical protein
VHVRSAVPEWTATHADEPIELVVACLVVNFEVADDDFWLREEEAARCRYQARRAC